MSTADEQGEADMEVNGALKRKAPSGTSPSAKRVLLDVEMKQEERQDQDQGKDADVELDLVSEERMVSEADVGIAAYVNESLIPINGGIIKHRYVLLRAIGGIAADLPFSQ